MVDGTLAEHAASGGLRIAVTDHPLREAVLAEVHARPFEQLSGPVRVSHLALVTGPDGELAEQERAGLERLCGAYGRAGPPPGAMHFRVDLGAFRLRWERHQEFSSYTVFLPGRAAVPFAEPAIARLPVEWLAALPGTLLTTVHLVLEGAEDPPRGLPAVERLFGTAAVCGSEVADGRALVYTDFRLHGDGFARVLVQDRGLPARQGGRLVQRLLEIETYRLMALLAFPLAREAAPDLARLESALGELSERLTATGGLEDEQRTLQELTVLASRLEQLHARTSFRLSAARAYSQLLRERLESLKERRIQDLQTMGKFLERRLVPAMRTCESIAQRQEALAQRLARTTDLLRARVDVALEAQNRDLLASMNRRTQMQLRLQETVEGLSVVVLSYYTVGLLGYLLKGGKALGLPLTPDLGLGLAVPVVVAGVWWTMRLLRRRLRGDLQASGNPGSLPRD